MILCIDPFSFRVEIHKPPLTSGAMSFLLRNAVTW
jgi:hypothetical protein